MVGCSLETSTPRAKRGEARVAAKAGSQVLKYFSLLFKGVISPHAELELKAAGFGPAQCLSHSGPASSSSMQMSEHLSKQQVRENHWRLLSCTVKTWATMQAERLCALAHALGTILRIQMILNWYQYSCECSHLQRKSVCIQLRKQDALQWGSAPVSQSWLLTIWHRNCAFLRHHDAYFSRLLRILFLCSNTPLHIFPCQSYSQE